MTKIKDEHVKEICKVGSGSSTCSYLMMGKGWECAKDTALEYTINERRKQRTINAKGDNCSGSPDFKINEKWTFETAFEQLESCEYISKIGPNALLETNEAYIWLKAKLIKEQSEKS